MLNATSANAVASTSGKLIPTSSSGNLGKSFTILGSATSRQGQQRLQKRPETYAEPPDAAEFAEVESEDLDSDSSTEPSTSKRRRY